MTFIPSKTSKPTSPLTYPLLEIKKYTATGYVLAFKMLNLIASTKHLGQTIIMIV
jgi:hypothetical protein